MSAPSIHIGLPDWSLFKFPPDPEPPALPPPVEEGSFKSPFPIPFDIYNKALDVRVPFTIGGVYIISVFLINAYNVRQGNKPWWFAKSRAFKTFVVLHNIFLAVYSGVTFLGMTRAMDRVWPGFDNPNGLAGVADALCKVHGPRGLGDAITYNITTSAWEAKNTIIKLLPEGTPDPTDVGRMWNEGLAFWGWWFYLSKFYEVLDTIIIVAKGKRSATLQTYHHAGAMLCMWAGIRYMSPPIWMFVWINSAIHTMMYTYYTLSALGIRVPTAIKRTLTTMQITQFLFGATFAVAHLLVSYDIPIATAYNITHPVSSLLSAASATATEAASTASSVIATPTLGSFIKRILLRAAGEEGVAENVRDPITHQPVLEGVKEAVQKYHTETRWRNEYHTVNCIDTTGQSFAIWLNVVYLAPLTALFVRFFYRAYISRGKAKGRRQSRPHKVERSAIEAARGVDREVDVLSKKAEKGVAKAGSKARDISEEVKRDLQALKDGKLNSNTNNKSSRPSSSGKSERPSSSGKSEQSSSNDKSSSENSKSSFQKSAEESVAEIKKEAKAIKEEVEEEIRGNGDDHSGDEHDHDSEQETEAARPGTSDSKTSTSTSTPSAQSSPSKKKRKHKKKNNNNNGSGAATGDSTASLATSSETLPEDRVLAGSQILPLAPTGAQIKSETETAKTES